MFAEKKGETLVKKPGDVGGREFSIRFLENCIVHLCDNSAQVRFAHSACPGHGRSVQRLHTGGGTCERLHFCARLREHDNPRGLLPVPMSRPKKVSFSFLKPYSVPRFTCMPPMTQLSKHLQDLHSRLSTLGIHSFANKPLLPTSIRQKTSGS